MAKAESHADPEPDRPDASGIAGRCAHSASGKIGRSAEHEESPVLAGMLRKVRHLVKVEDAT